MHRRWTLLPVALAALVLGAGTASAEEKRPVCPVCLNARDDVDYPTKMGATIARGAVNTLFGWTEIMRVPAEEAKRGQNPAIGIANGIGQATSRTIAGVGDLLTFWTPKVKRDYLHFAHDCPICLGRMAEKNQAAPAPTTPDTTPSKTP